jgi:hypothetical protein
MVTDEEIKAGMWAMIDKLYPDAIAVDLPILDDARELCRVILEAAAKVRQ